MMAMVGLTGCSGADAGPPASAPATVPTAPDPVATTVATPEATLPVMPTIEAEPDTVPVTSVPATSSVPVPTSAPSTVTTPSGDATPPARITFPDDASRQAVVDAAYAFFDAARAAQAEPTDAGARAALAATVAEPLAGRMTAFLDGLVADGVRIVGSEASPTYLDIVAPTVMVAGERALFDACAVDSDIRRRADTGEVLDDDVVSSIQSYSVMLTNGSWRVSGFTVFDVWEGSTECG